jgi:hypothetical protein
MNQRGLEGLRFRTIYGELSVKDVAPEDLPKKISK